MPVGAQCAECGSTPHVADLSVRVPKFGAKSKEMPISASIFVMDRHVHAFQDIGANMQVGSSEVFESSSYDDLDAGWDSDDRDRIGAHRIALLRTYFARFGLWDEATSQAAAHRVVNEVLQTARDWNDTEIDRRLVAVARKWIRDFAESRGSGPGPGPSVDSPVPNWLSRAPVLLSKFPSAFLATPLPRSSN